MIDKATVSGIKRMEIHDGDGLRTTVFFKGCPLKCVWCHNPESIGYMPQIAHYSNKCIKCGECKRACKSGALNISGDAVAIDRDKCSLCFECVNACPTEAMVGYGTEYTVDELFREIMTELPFFEKSGGGVTFSGGECLTQAEFVTELAKKLHDAGVSVDIDTCGYVKREVLEKIIPYTDVFLYDIKAIDPSVHMNCTGKDNKLILDNLKFLSEQGCKIEIRYPLVVGYNDGECRKIARFLSELPGIVGIKVLKYHSFAASRYSALGMNNTLPEPLTTDEDVKNARKVMSDIGLKVKI